ncbi:uncharacterized protein LOC121405114 isoform X2 [Drosophila obscura]|nr:uncharacterized protein LOC121405114 isoform X2 [Drosophila obscura]
MSARGVPSVYSSSAVRPRFQLPLLLVPGLLSAAPVETSARNRLPGTKAVSARDTGTIPWLTDAPVSSKPISFIEPRLTRANGRSSWLIAERIAAHMPRLLLWRAWNLTRALCVLAEPVRAISSTSSPIILFRVCSYRCCLSANGLRSDHLAPG